jgi:hypothetical protein
MTQSSTCPGSLVVNVSMPQFTFVSVDPEQPKRKSAGDEHIDGIAARRRRQSAWFIASIKKRTIAKLLRLPALAPSDEDAPQPRHSRSRVARAARSSRALSRLTDRSRSVS